MSIQQLVRTLQKLDNRREEVRHRVLEQDGQRGSFDAEIVGLNQQIEGAARRLNGELAKLARSGGAGSGIEVGNVIDPELKAYLEEVKRTLDHLKSADTTTVVSQAPSPDVSRTKAEGEKIKREIEKRKKQYAEEIKKTDRLIEEQKREQRNLDQEERKIKNQNGKMLDKREKLVKEKADASAKQQAASKEAAKLERAKAQQLSDLKSTTDGGKRRSLEQRIQKTNHALRQQKHAADVQKACVERYQRILDSMKRELDQIDEALDRIEDERKRFKEDQEKLQERKKQLQDAIRVEDKRLVELQKAERTLSAAR